MAGNYAVSIVARKMNTLGTSVVGILISILGFFLLIAFSSIPSFVIGAGLVEFGFGMEQAATRTWMCDHIKSETRSTYSSIFSTGSDGLDRGGSGNGSGYCNIGCF